MQLKDSQGRTVERLKLQRAALADFGLFAFQCADIDELLNRASALVAGALEVSFAKVLEHHPEKGEMLIRGGVNWQPGVVGHESFGDDEKSPGGYALKCDHPVISRDMKMENRFDIPEVLVRHGVKSMVNVVIVGKDVPYGVLEVDDQKSRDFSEDDVAFLRTYANLLAAAVERVRLHQRLTITARDQSLVAREMGHRVRNLLGIVRALASQPFTNNQTVEEFRQGFVGRLQALSVAESLLFESKDERVDLMTLSQKILAPHQRDEKPNITIEGVALALPQRQSRMFGLALHELATNATKYGALGAADGTVSLKWYVEGETPVDSQLTLIWQEADGPEIVPPQRKGFGTRLLNEVVAHELNGKAELIYGERGLCYRLKFPIRASYDD